MPPKVKPLEEEDDDALFEAPLFPANDNDNDSDASLEGVDPDDPALFDAPLFAKDVYDPERSPSPPAWEPKNWWEEILGKANVVVGTDEGRAGGWRAALQGATLNTADNLTRWASPSFADSLDQAAKEYPGSHGVGQMFPRTAAAVLAGPSVLSQGMAQSGVSGLASAFDGGSFDEVLGNMGLGALEGVGGAVVGKGLGTVGRAITDTAPAKWVGRQFGRLMPAADDAALPVGRGMARRDPFAGRRGELARMPLEPDVPLGPPAPPDPFAGRRGELARTLSEPDLPVGPPAPPDPFIGRRGGLARTPLEADVPVGPPGPPDPFIGRRGELARTPLGPEAPLGPSAPPDPFAGRRGELARMPLEPMPRAPYPPAPSAPPPAPDMDEEALAHLLGGPPKAARGEGGRFVKRPYETQVQKRLQRNGPREQPSASLTEPPVPMPPEPRTDLELAYEPSPRAPRAWMETPEQPLELAYQPSPRAPRPWMEAADQPLELAYEPAPRTGRPWTAPAPDPEMALAYQPSPRAPAKWGKAPEQPLELAYEPGPARAKLPESAPYDVPLREGASSLGSEEPGIFSDLIDVASIQTPRGALRGAAASARLGKRALNAIGGPSDASGMATAGRVATGIGWDTGLPDLLNQKVNAQDYSAPTQEERAPVADAPTLHYALQATLASGRAGLSPEDEQALTEAVIQGDQSAISATDFRLRQRYPAYARAVERELRSYNEEN